MCTDQLIAQSNNAIHLQSSLLTFDLTLLIVFESLPIVFFFLFFFGTIFHRILIDLVRKKILRSHLFIKCE